jgi:hypothetical protein
MEVSYYISWTPYLEHLGRLGVDLGRSPPNLALSGYSLGLLT